MPTVKSVIVPEVSTSLTTAYTNSTGSGATLKAVNATGVADPTVWGTTASAASEFTFFGTSTPTFVGPDGQTAGNTAPFPIQLSADRVLLLWTPANIHCGGQQDYLGGTVLHSQIVEWTGTIYRAGPIVNIPLPAAFFNSQTIGLWTRPNGATAQVNQMLARAVALTATKVALVLRNDTNFHLLRLNISGNSVDQANIVNFALTGATAFNSTTAFAFDVSPVLDNTNKVVVMGSNGTNWSMQSYNIPDSGALTVDSTLFSTGLAHTTGSAAFAPLTATVNAANTTTYVVAANTSTTVTLSIQHVAFNSSTSIFSTVGTPVTITNTATTGIAVRTLSSDATANAVVAYINTGANSQMAFARQTSLTQSTNTITTTTLSAAATRALKVSFNWGTSRAVFLAETNGLVVYDSTGTGTALISSSDTNSTTQCQTYWYPFNSRPLYTVSDTNSTTVGRVPQFITRANIANATSVGTAQLIGNYLPYGFPYQGHHSWNEKAQCWMIGQGGRIYAISTTGAVLNEVSLYNLGPTIATSSVFASIKALECTPSGRIYCLTDSQGTLVGSWYGIQWSSATASLCFGFGLMAVTSSQTLSSANLLSPPFLFTSQAKVVIDLESYTDYSGIERALGLYIETTTNANVYAVRFDGGQWLNGGNTSVTTTSSSSFHVGTRPNLRLVQDSPADAANQTGLWRLIGLTALNSSANMATQAISTTAVSDSGITNVAVGTVINNSTAAVYPTVKAESYNTMFFAYYDPLALVGRYYFCIAGRLTTGLYGLPIAGPNTTQFVNVITTKYGFAASPCNTSTSALAQSIYLFDSVTAPAGPRAILTATSGNGWTTLIRDGQAQLDVFANGINNQYSVSGPDTALLHVSISSGAADFFVTPVIGQPVSTSTSAAYRNTDVYFVPNGYSVKLKTNLPVSLSALLSVVEDV